MLEVLNQLDGQLLLWVQEYIRHPALTGFFKFITSLGDAGIIWIAISIALLIPKKTRHIGCMSLMALLCSLIINNFIIKNIVARPRPYVTLSDLTILIAKPSEFSFPSGHTASSFAAACVFFRHLKKKYGIPLLILAILIALSRIYVGVHYPGDVLAGVISGILLSYLGEFIVKKFGRKHAVT